jgi:hypothetical protein
MIEQKINRITLIEKLSSMRYEELSELQLHSIFLELGYVDTKHYMATEDNVCNYEQNEP